MDSELPFYAIPAEDVLPLARSTRRRSPLQNLSAPCVTFACQRPRARRAPTSASLVVQALRVPVAFDEFTFDELQLELYRRGERVKVDAQVLRLLSVLVSRPNTFMSHDELIATAWEGRTLGENVVSVAVAKLRKALADREGRRIQNAYGRGYRFASALSSLPPPLAHDKSASAPQLASLRLEEGPPLVGREFALRSLTQALEAALGGRGGLCALIGEAGVGKTRLAESLVRTAQARGARVAWGRCYEDDEAAVLGPWLQVSDALGAEKPAVWSQATAAEAAGPLAWLGTVQWLSALCRSQAAPHGALFLLDDLQWADAASLALLLRIAPELASQRLLVVATVRSASLDLSDVENAPLRRVLGHRACERLSLGRLSEQDVAQYLLRVRGREEPALSRTVFAKSEGNAFFMVELVRALEQGVSSEPELLTLRGPALEIVHASLRRVSEEAREALTMAAVLGRRFALSALAHLASVTPSVLLERLESALRAALLKAEGDDNTTFAFGHDLVRSALYEGMPRGMRARLHLRAAEYVTTHGTGVPTLRRNAELARHRLCALPEGDVPLAIAAARHAALAAERMGAHADAAGLHARALSASALLSVPDPRIRAELSLALAREKRAAGIPDFGAHLLEAVTLARAHGYGHVLVDAGEMMSGGPGTLSMPGVTTTLEAARDALGPEERELRARVLSHLAVSSPYCRDVERVRALLDEADALAGSTGVARLVLLRQRVYYASGPAGDEAAEALTRELERLTEDASSVERAWRMPVQFDRLLRAQQRGAHDESAGLLQRFTAFARELRHAELIWHCERIAALMHVNAGEIAQARARFDVLHAEAEELGLYARKEILAFDEAELGRYVARDARDTAQQMRDIVLRRSDPPNVQASKLRVLVSSGELSAARNELRAWPVEEFSRLPPSRDYLATLGYLAYVSAATEERAHAEALYALLLPHASAFAVSVSFHHFGAVALQLARLAQCLGEQARAIMHYEEALALHAGHGLLPLATSTRLELARVLDGSPKGRGQAGALRDVARRDAERLGMTALL